MEPSTNPTLFLAVKGNAHGGTPSGMIVKSEKLRDKRKTRIVSGGEKRGWKDLGG